MFQAVAADDTELAVGSIIGSNITNVLLVLRSTSALTPGGIGVSEDAVNLDLPIMLAAAFACLPLVAWALETVVVVNSCCITGVL